ncbi:MAG: hypothetical protein LBE95_03765, partial [Holosporaceae bacterium]|nr:hypothetical protein [Holosporaceae bacterium]
NKETFLTKEDLRRQKIIEKEDKERIRMQMAEERKRTTFFRKSLRTVGIGTAGFLGFSLVKWAGKKVINTLLSGAKDATNVLNRSFVTNEKPQNTQAFSSWINDKGLDEKSVYGTLDRYAEVTKIKDQPYTKIMERFLKEAQKATPKQLSAALGHGADPEFLRRIKDYGGNFSEELKGFKEEGYSDEDLKKMERLGVSWRRFVHIASKAATPILVGASEKAANELDAMSSNITAVEKGIKNFFGAITNFKIPDFKLPNFASLKTPSFLLPKNAKEVMNVMEKMEKKVEEESKKEPKFSTPLNERLAAAKESLGTSTSSNKKIVQNFTFNIKSTDPEKASQEVAKRIKESLMNKIFMPEATIS